MRQKFYRILQIQTFLYNASNSRTNSKRDKMYFPCWIMEIKQTAFEQKKIFTQSCMKRDFAMRYECKKTFLSFEYKSEWNLVFWKTWERWGKCMNLMIKVYALRKAEWLKVKWKLPGVYGINFLLPLRIISLFVRLFIHGFSSLIENFMTVILFAEIIMKTKTTTMLQCWMLSINSIFQHAFTVLQRMPFAMSL